MLASQLPWAQMETALVPEFARQVCEGRTVAQGDLSGPSVRVASAVAAAAGRPQLPLRRWASLMHFKHAYHLSDEELVQRWPENIVGQHFSGMRFYECVCRAMPRSAGPSDWPSARLAWRNCSRPPSTRLSPATPSSRPSSSGRSLTPRRRRKR
mgnify:CR=1 FL=1